MLQKPFMPVLWHSLTTRAVIWHSFAGRFCSARLHSKGITSSALSLHPCYCTALVCRPLRSRSLVLPLYTHRFRTHPARLFLPFYIAYSVPSFSYRLHKLHRYPHSLTPYHPSILSRQALALIGRRRFGRLGTRNLFSAPPFHSG